jgi:DNA polymerase type B, organellar and viral
VVILRHDVSGHYIRRNHSSSFPRDIIAFDTETNYTQSLGLQLHVMRLAWACYVHLDLRGEIERESWRYFTKRAELCEWLRDMAVFRKKIFLVGTNVFFDLQASGFFKYFTLWGWSLDFVYEKGHTYILKIKTNGAQITAVSTTNYLDASVKSLGAMIGMAKLEVDFASTSEDDLCIYCQRDCEITLEAFLRYLRFVISQRMGRFALTRASQSMAAFRHRFMAIKIYRHSDQTILDLEERAYFGGRTEAFQLGDIQGGPFMDLDINSMYPYVMKTRKMPIKAKDYFSKLSKVDLIDMLKGYGVIAHVTLSTLSPIYPLRSGLKILFPVGTFDTYLCTESLKIACERGHISRVHAAAVYEMGDPFVDYIDHFYAMRQAAKLHGDKVMDSFAKLFMNSLYGKFAQKTAIELENITYPCDEYSKLDIFDPLTMQMVTIVQLLNRRIVTRGSQTSASSVVAIPAHVTDYGRCLLWSIIESTGEGTVLYCDTDSVKIRQKDLWRVGYPIDQTRIGRLKVEGSYDTLSIYGAKDYQSEKLCRLKGVPSKAEKLSAFDYRYQSFARQSTHLRLGNQESYIIRDVRKHLSRQYTKGSVTACGLVLPWCLPKDRLRLG